jgi:hypothetical protein
MLETRSGGMATVVAPSGGAAAQHTGQTAMADMAANADAAADIAAVRAAATMGIERKIVKLLGLRERSRPADEAAVHRQCHRQNARNCST